MAQTDSNSEYNLDSLTSGVKRRWARGKNPPAAAQPVGGLKPSEILFMSSGQQKIITYLSHQRQASIVDIQQALGIDQLQIVKELTALKDNGYVHEVLTDGGSFYRVKFAETVNKSGNLPRELWNALSLDGAAFLRQLPLFKSLSETDLGLLSRQFKQEHYSRNEVIVRQGDLAKSFFIIKSGMVGVSNLSSSGTYNLIRYLEQGDFFGESGLLTGQSISATITAFTPVEIFFINKDDFDAMLVRHVGIAIELARTLAHRLTSTNTRLANKFNDSRLFLVVSTGRHFGAHTVANAMALMIAPSSKDATAYVEFSGEDLSSVYGFPSSSEVYDHPGGFKILQPQSSVDIPELAQVTFVLDQAGAQYKNIVACISWELAQKLGDLIRSASQIVMVTSSQREDWEHAQKVIASFKPYIRADRTRLFTIVNHVTPETSDNLDNPSPDFVIPFLDNLLPIAERRVENLPKPLTKVVEEIFSLLGYTSQIGIYIPTTTSVNQHADTSPHVGKTLSFMGRLFGGATLEDVQGVWNSQGSGLVEEQIHLVRSYCSQSALDKHMTEVVEYVETLKQELRQEAMALEVNQKLMLI
ncbi:MAG: cyclic nucleotide-binding domain-containing protein [Chloroflexi bacterium]|nr:cyclic nucleotide-binding domain-containing protein [Chloroflexota bacterium]